jgi:hypothetical protein
MPPAYPAPGGIVALSQTQLAFVSLSSRRLRLVGWIEETGGLSDEIARAMGIVAVQADCSLSKALLLMRARAESSEVSLDDVAKGVLDGTIRWDR